MGDIKDTGKEGTENLRDKCQDIIELQAQTVAVIERIVGSEPGKDAEALNFSGSLPELIEKLEIADGQARYVLRRIEEIEKRI